MWLRTIDLEAVYFLHFEIPMPQTDSLSFEKMATDFGKVELLDGG